MPILKGFPLVSQLSNVTSDGNPPEDAQFSCVAASIGAAILYYQGKTQWDTDINPDRMKDAAMGQGYTGGTAATAYVDFCKSLGYKLYPFDGNPGQLVSEIHRQLGLGHPVVVTVPDVYVPSSYGWSHVLCAYGDGNGTITCLDPYIAKPLTKSDQEWNNLLLFNQIWIVEKEDEVITIDIHNPAVATRFDEINPHQWKSKKTGKIIQYAMLSNYKQEGNSGNCGLDELGDVLSNEVPLQGYPPRSVKQYYEFGVRGWNSATGKVFPLALYGGPGEDPRIAEQQAQIDQLKQQIANQPKPDEAPLNAIKQVQPLIDQAQQALAPFK